MEEGKSILLIEQLFINLTIVTTALFLYHQIFKDYLYSYTHHLKGKVFLGFLTGVLAVLLMRFGIHIGEQTIIDLRHIPLMLATLFGGWLPTVISATIIVIARFMIGVNLSAMANLVLIISLSISFILIVRQINGIWRASIVMLTLSNIFFSIISYQILGTSDIYVTVNIAYWITSLLSGVASVYMNSYLRKTNKLMKEYERNAFQDALTGLNNVRSFDKSFNNLSKRVTQKKETLSLLVIDIDYFKKINDTYGHPEGDEILKQVGKLLKQEARQEDVVSRNGGEEFTILMHNCFHEVALQASEKIRKRIERYPFEIHHGHTKKHLTVSIGVATYPKTVSETKDLYRVADQALYNAKNNGRNRVASA